MRKVLVLLGFICIISAQQLPGHAVIEEHHEYELFYKNETAEHIPFPIELKSDSEEVDAMTIDADSEPVKITPIRATASKVIAGDPSTAMDKSFRDFVAVEAENIGGSVFLKLELEKVYPVHRVTLHMPFYTGWYNSKSYCVKDLEAYYQCLDDGSQFQVNVFNGEAFVGTCGIVMLSYGLTQNDQIYKLECPEGSVGDSVVLSKSSGFINVLEVVIEVVEPKHEEENVGWILIDSDRIRVPFPLYEQVLELKTFPKPWYITDKVYTNGSRFEKEASRVVSAYKAGVKIGTFNFGLVKFANSLDFALQGCGFYFKYKDVPCPGHEEQIWGWDFTTEKVLGRCDGTTVIDNVFSSAKVKSCTTIWGVGDIDELEFRHMKGEYYRGILKSEEEKPAVEKPEEEKPAVEKPEPENPEENEPETPEEKEPENPEEKESEKPEDKEPEEKEPENPEEKEPEKPEEKEPEEREPEEKEPENPEEKESEKTKDKEPEVKEPENPEDKEPEEKEPENPEEKESEKTKDKEPEVKEPENPEEKEPEEKEAETTDGPIDLQPRWINCGNCWTAECGYCSSPDCGIKQEKEIKVVVKSVLKRKKYNEIALIDSKGVRIGMFRWSMRGFFLAGCAQCRASIPLPVSQNGGVTEWSFSLKDGVISVDIGNTNIYEKTLSGDCAEMYADVSYSSFKGMDCDKCQIVDSMQVGISFNDYQAEGYCDESIHKIN